MCSQEVLVDFSNKEYVLCTSSVYLLETYIEFLFLFESNLVICVFVRICSCHLNYLIY